MSKNPDSRGTAHPIDVAAGAVPGGSSGSIRVCKHAEVVRIATDPNHFSSAVSRFVQIPNGLDGVEHARFRALVDRYFTPEAMLVFAPACRAVARDLVAGLPRDRAFDAMRDLGAPFAVRAQSAWLGWPIELERTLLDWLETRQAAVRSGDPARNVEVAERFDSIIRSLIEPRRSSDGTRDVTDRLIHDESAGRPLEDAEIVSILRNWTGGDLGSIALAVGVIVHDLAADPDLAARLRGVTEDESFDRYLEEVLRRDDPFVASRRVTARGAVVAGERVAAGRRIALDWAAANRDAAVFPSPDRFDPDGNAARNLVYGIGPHACPGRPLARLELRELTRALLADAPELALAGSIVREELPLGGYRSVPVRLAPQ
jgi:cytochrome P450